MGDSKLEYPPSPFIYGDGDEHQHLTAVPAILARM